MANSIANLAVVISGHTKPLEDSMKKAKSKVDTFGHSFKEGAMLGAGVMGVDKLEQAMKKAIAGNEQLAEAAEKAEESFGKILLKVTGIGAILPKAASALEQFSKYMESNDTKSGFSFDVQVFKEQAASLFMSSETRMKELGTMRAQWEEATKLAQLDELRAQLAKDQLEAQKKKDELVKSEMESYSNSLKSKIESLDPASDDKKIAEFKKTSKDPFLLAEIELRKMQVDELEAKKKAQEELNKVMEEGKKTTEAYESDTEKMIRKQMELNEQFQKGAINSATYQRAIASMKPAYTSFSSMFKDIAAELAKKDILDFQEKAAKLIEEQVPELERYRKEYEKAVAAYKAGNINKDQLGAFSKQYADALKKQNANEVRLSGAGRDTAYSTLANAMASGKRDVPEVQQLEVQKQQLVAQQEIKKSHANAEGYLKLLADQKRRVINVSLGSL